ncbi:MAG: cytochrome c3 family protein [Symbiobacteriia bacterium]
MDTETEGTLANVRRPRWPKLVAALSLVAGIVIFWSTRTVAVDVLGGDGGFEVPGYSNWTPLLENNLTVSQDGADKVAGSYSARLAGGAAGAGLAVRGALVHSFTPSNYVESVSLRVSFKKAVTAAPPAAFDLYYEIWDAAGVTQLTAGRGFVDRGAGAAPWTTQGAIPVSLAGQLLPGTTYTLRLGIDATTGNDPAAGVTAWFDEVSLEIVYDTQPPTVVFTGGPAEGGYVNTLTPIFTWVATDNVTPSQSLLNSSSADGGATWTVVGAGTSATPAYPSEGPWTFLVRSKDQAGNESQPVTRQFTIDQTPPTATIIGGPGSGSTAGSQNVTFTWSGTDNYAPAASLTYEYSTDGGAGWTAAGAATSVTVTYAEGTDRTFALRAADPAGNTGSPDSCTFNIDVTGPSVAFTGGPAEGSFTAQRRPTFTWSGSDNQAANANLLYRFSSNGGSTWSAYAAATSATLSQDYPEGGATFTVQGKDPTGNQGPLATVHFTVDVTPPPISSVTTTPDITSAAVAWSTAGDPSTSIVRYGSTPGIYTSQVSDAAFAQDHRLTLTGLGPNTPYYYVIEATDRAGNVSASPERSFATLPDNVPPDTTITGGPAGGSHQKSRSLTFSFTGTDNWTVAANLAYSYSTDGGVTWSTYSPATSATAQYPADGLNLTFQVHATDEAGNTDPTPAVRTFTVDATAPALTVTGGPASGSYVTTVTPAFTWVGSDNITDGQNLQYAISFDGGTTWGPWGHATDAAPSFAEGAGRSFAVKARDLAGNESPMESRTFTVDATAPAVTLTGGPGEGTLTHVQTQTFVWSGSDNLTAAPDLWYSYSSDGGVTWSPFGPTTTATVTYADGAGLSFRVKAQDQAGNEGAPAGRTFSLDSTPPAVTGLVVTPARTTLTLSWSTAGDPSTSVVRYGMAAGVYSATLADAVLREDHTIVLPALAPGVRYFYVIESTDRAGNQAATTEYSASTDADTPHVLATLPDAGDTAAGTGVKIKVTFDVDMDPATLNAGTLQVTEAQTAAALTFASMTYEAGTRSVILTPASPLAAGTTYMGTVTTGVRSATGTPMPAVFSWSFTTGPGAFATPHGSFSTNNNACKNCHTAHAALTPELLNKADISTVCFTCHDGTGSSSDVKGQFTGAGASGSLHPVKNVPVVSKSLLNCSDCHNPHGDARQDGTLYPRLLRVSLAGGGYVYGGNAFCLACHGPNDRAFSAIYYAGTAGDHSSSTAAHYQNFAPLVPSSGTGITCTSCHQSHATPNLSLLKQGEENLCLSCHNNPANSQSGRNIQDEFNNAAYKSRHDIYSLTGAKVECSSCHGPHTAAKAQLTSGGSASEVSSPANTKQDMAGATTATTPAGRYTDFCLSCHNGNPPQQKADATTRVPYSVAFQARDLTTNGGGGGADTTQRGWDKSTYRSSAHYQAGLGCNDCHASHSSAYDNLTSRPEDTATSGTAGVCGKCHSGSPPAQFASAPNLWPDLTRTGSPSPDRYRHPTLYISDQHSDTEDYAALKAQGKRHAECLDCHDPHNEQAGAAAPPAPPGPLRNVSGVAVDYGTVTWSQWNPAGGSPVMRSVNPISSQFELCFKCHTYASFQNSPPQPAGGIAETDVAREFNPNNPSYHAVVGVSTFVTQPKTFKDSSGVTHYYGKFAVPVTGDPATRDSQGNPWSATSRLYCEDCHRSGADNVKGPHGSNYWYILRAPWTRATGAEGIGGTGGPNTQDHLCFKCHDYNFYASGVDRGSTTVRSQFAGSGYPYNLHARHSGRGCSSCHVTVVHGWKLRSLLADKGPNGDSTKPAPYYDSSYLIINTWRSAGSWRENDCDHTHA